MWEVEKNWEIFLHSIQSLNFQCKIFLSWQSASRSNGILDKDMDLHLHILLNHKSKTLLV